MVRPDHLGAAADSVLSWLWDLDARAGGYTRRGVRGWASREEIEAGTKMRLPEVLPRLRDRSLVDEDQVHVPGTRPVAVYRITGHGDLLLARHQGREALPPWPAGDPGPEDDAVYLPPGPSLALRMLREALSDPRPSPHPGLGIGWRTEDELREEIAPALDGWDGLNAGPWLPGDPPWQQYTSPPAGHAQTDPSPGFDGVDLAWLERAGLVQRTRIVPPRRKRPVTLWRVSDLGAELTELVWHQPREPER
jgi:hypothetical protein